MMLVSWYRALLFFFADTQNRCIEGGAVLAVLTGGHTRNGLMRAELSKCGRKPLPFLFLSSFLVGYHLAQQDDELKETTPPLAFGAWAHLSMEVDGPALTTVYVFPVARPRPSAGKTTWRLQGSSPVACSPLAAKVVLFGRWCSLYRSGNPNSDESRQS